MVGIQGGRARLSKQQQDLHAGIELRQFVSEGQFIVLTQRPIGRLEPAKAGWQPVGSAGDLHLQDAQGHANLQHGSSICQFDLSRVKTTTGSGPLAEEVSQIVVHLWAKAVSIGGLGYSGRAGQVIKKSVRLP
jgi:hypothetical protein